MHLDSRSLHAPSALGVERRKEKNSCPAGLKPCTVVLADLELKCMDTFFPSAWYKQTSVRKSLPFQSYFWLGRDALLCEQGRKREQASIDIFYFSFLSITFYLVIFLFTNASQAVLKLKLVHLFILKYGCDILFFDDKEVPEALTQFN